MSKIEVNAVEPQCGTTLTLGASGDTVTLGSGASQSGFGRTGTVDWQTTPKTGNFTAANGEGYFVNTTSGAITMTMPSGSAGAIVSIQDYNKTFDSNAFTVAPASGEKINGGNASQNLVISTEGQGLTFVYVDGTVGWKTVHENEFITGGSSFITATGGTITTSGNDTIHTFTGPGTFAVCKLAVCAANNKISYMVVAGGGGGGANHGGGGGAGGFRETKSPVTPYTASPLDGSPSAPNIITVTATSYPITVGAGGASTPSSPGAGNPGSNSIFSTVTSAGGGGGGKSSIPASSGGSGGGNGDTGGPGNPGAAGNTPPVSPPQGNNGGACGHAAPNYGQGGGGGATAVGVNGTPTAGGCGGAGATTSISGSPTTYAGGGGASTYQGGATCKGQGGSGGGGLGTIGGPAPNQRCGTVGTANTGGGGGGGERATGGPGSCTGFGGGSGIVIIRYKSS